jgi:hypothetical protein
MGLSNRLFLLDKSDVLHRLAAATFEQMLHNPASHPIPSFAGARVRMAHVLVECLQRQPTRLVWSAFSILTFDGNGVLDATAFEQHQYARAESALAPLVAKPVTLTIVVDAARRFIAKGGHWEPSKAVAATLEQAALGRIKCPRL